MSLQEAEVVVVGAGFFGATIANLIATRSGRKVLVIDRRDHPGGNAFSETDADTNIELHRYGAHIFHTSNDEIWNYINKFTSFNDYRHRVFARYRNNIYSLPINLATICQYFGKDISPDAARALIGEQAGEHDGAAAGNLEEKAISLIGRPLYEAFIKGYTAKQWETDPTLLSAEIIKRLPVRFNFDNRYFSDRYEGIPVEGYTGIFRAMLDNRLIRLALSTDYFDIRAAIPPGVLVIHTGPIDRFFDYRFGRLGWRTLDFEWERMETDDYQGTSVINESDPDVPYTRSIEFRHFHPERRVRAGRTIVAREYSRFARPGDEPFYPIDTPADREILARYMELARSEPDVLFGGRLGTYQYLDMHQAIGAAFSVYARKVVPWLERAAPGLEIASCQGR